MGGRTRKFALDGQKMGRIGKHMLSNKGSKSHVKLKMDANFYFSDALLCDFLENIEPH